MIDVTFDVATGFRTRAMLACGALRDAALLPKYESLLFPKSEGGGEAMVTTGMSGSATATGKGKSGRPPTQCDKRDISRRKYLAKESFQPDLSKQELGFSDTTSRNIFSYLG